MKCPVVRKFALWALLKILHKGDEGERVLFTVIQHLLVEDFLIFIRHFRANHIDIVDHVLEPYPSEAWDYNRLKVKCFICQPSVFFKRELTDELGVIDESLEYCMDYEFWLRVSVVEDFLLLDEPLTLKDGGRSDQVSSIFRIGMDKFRISAIEKILVAGRLNPAQARLALAELATKCRIYGNGCLKHGRQEEGENYLALPEKISAQVDYGT